MKLYLKVTPDELQLPLDFSFSLNKFAKKHNVSKYTITSEISKRKIGCAKNPSFDMIVVPDYPCLYCASCVYYKVYRNGTQGRCTNPTKSKFEQQRVRYFKKKRCKDYEMNPDDEAIRILMHMTEEEYAEAKEMCEFMCPEDMDDEDDDDE